MEFLRTFTNEPSCEDYLIQVRWPEGMRCPSCGSGSFYQRLRNRRAYECRSCHHFTFPTAGTIFDHTRTSLHQWFIAMFLVAMDKRDSPHFSWESTWA